MDATGMLMESLPVFSIVRYALEVVFLVPGIVCFVKYLRWERQRAGKAAAGRAR